MPGLSNRNPVPGYGNMGKVHIRYKEKKPPSYKIGLFFYLLCLVLFLFSFTWTRKQYRYSITLPLMRQVVSSFDSGRLWLDSHHRNFPADKVSKHSLLSGNVTISFGNPSGVIEVAGESVEDVLYGQGYAHCSERLFQMDYNRRKAAGTLAEVFDSDKVSSDKFARSLDLAGLALRDLSAQSPEELRLLQAYAAGVNAYLAESHSLPLEYGLVGITDSAEVPRWLPEHSLALLRLHTTAMGSSSSEAWQRELTLSLLQDRVGAEKAAAWGLGSSNSDSGTCDKSGSGSGSGLAEGVGAVLLPSASSSLAYVVSGRLTLSGAPLSSAALVMEPEAPSAVIQNTLSVAAPGPLLHVTGASFPGVPLVTLAGRTDRVSWSLTPAAVDTADLFLEEIRVQRDEQGGVSYSYLHAASRKGEGGEEDWRPAALRRETITVRPSGKRGESSEASQVTLDCLQTERGAVLAAGSLAGFHADFLRQHQGAHSHRALALASVDRLHPLHLGPWLQLNSAQNWGDFNAALRPMHALAWNALYADSANNIGSRVTGRAPRRAAGHCGETPRHGSAPGGGWATDQVASFEQQSLAQEPSSATEARTNTGEDTTAEDGQQACSAAEPEICESCVLNPPSGVIFSLPASQLASSPGELLPAALAPFEQLLAAARGSGAGGPGLGLSDLLRMEAAPALALASANALLGGVARVVHEAAQHPHLRPASSWDQDDHRDSSGEQQEAALQALLLFLQGQTAAGADAGPVFLEVFRLAVRDIVLDGSAARGLGPLVHGASHSPLQSTTALLENVALVDAIIITAAALGSSTDAAAQVEMQAQNASRVVVVQAALVAFSWLQEQHGAPVAGWLGGGWRWRDMHAMRFQHPFLAREYMGEVLSPGPVWLPATPSAARASRLAGGGGDSVLRRDEREHGELGCVLAGRWGSSGRCRTTVYRAIHELTSPAPLPSNFYLNAPGQSGRQGSPHYTSALAAWASGELLPLPFAPAAAEDAHVTILSPPLEIEAPYGVE